MRKACLIALFAFIGSASVWAQSTSSVTFPLSFERNVGQSRSTAVFLARVDGRKLFLDKQTIEVPVADLGHPSASLRMQFLGANVNPKISAESPTGGHSNYYLASDPKLWITGLPLYGRVRYTAIYPGIDAVFHGSSGQLEYDFELAPGSDAGEIVLDFGRAEIEKLSLDGDGNLLVTIAGQQVRMLAPRAYQETPHASVQASYRLLGRNRVGFAVAAYDHSRQLIIDPVVAYTAIIGANSRTTLDAMTADSAGNILVSGVTYASDYPVTVGNNIALGQSAAYITKLDPTGTQILFSTELLAGIPNAVALGPQGSVFMAGIAGDGFPVTSQSIAACGSPCNAGFVAKFDSSGQLQFSTLLASGQVLPKAITVDSAGSAYVTGLAADSTLPLVNPYQQTYQGGICTSCFGAFFAKLNPTGTAYEFSSYFSTPAGGTRGSAIALDTNGNLYLAGIGTVPLLHPLQSLAGSLFISKFAPDGRTLLASTMFGSGGDTLAGMAVGGDGTVYIAGSTLAADFPYTLNVALPLYRPDYFYNGTNAFAAAFKSDLSGLKFAVPLGSGQINALAFSGSQLHLAGQFSPDALRVKNAVVSDIGPAAGIVSLDASGAVVMATQFGGHVTTQIPNGIGVDGSGNIYVAGTPDSNFNTPSGSMPDPVNVGTGQTYLNQAKLGLPHFPLNSTFIAKISSANQPQISLSVYQPNLVLRNVGSADLHIQNITLGGGLQKQWGNCGTTVKAGEACVLTVTDNNGSTAFGGTVTIDSDATPASQTFAPLVPGSTNFLVGPLLWLSPSTLSFAPQQIGTTSPTQSARLWNVGAATVTLGNIFATGTLNQTNDCQTTISPGSFCTIQLSITPNSNSTGGNLAMVLADGSRTDTFFYSIGSDQPLLLSTSGMYFGGITVGATSLNRSVTITNTSNSIASAPAIGIGGAKEFAIVSNSCLADLPPKQSCIVTVSFTPGTNGDSSGQLTVSSGGSSSQVQLAGTGLIDSAVSVYPLQVLFYNVVIGTTSFPQIVTLKNNGSSTVKVTGIQFSIADFSQTNTCQDPIPPDGSCTVSIAIQPQDIGDRGGTLTVSFDSASSQVIPITANAVPPMYASVTSLDFGFITPVGSDSNPQNMSLNALVNGGQSQPYTLEITGDFRVENSYCPNPMPSSYGCNFPVFFHPAKPGTQTGALTVTFPQTSAKLVVTLTGTASSAGITLTPLTLDFGTVMATTPSAAQVITLTNPQQTTLTIPAPIVAGSGSSDFHVTWNCGSIAPGATCQVPVVFLPAAAGNRGATLTIQNGGDPATLIPIPLNGIGSPAPGLSIDASGRSFGWTDVGTATKTLSLVVTNLGPHTASLPALTKTGLYASEFTATPEAACSALAPQASCNINVVFAPLGRLTRAATISFPSGGTNSQTLSVNLEGEGIDFAVSANPSALSKNITKGQSASFVVGLAADTFYTSQVNLSCSVPAGASYGPCSVSPTSVSQWNAATLITVAVTPTALASSQSPNRLWWIMPATLLLPLALFRQGRRVSATVIALVVVAALLACGGGGGGGGSVNTGPPAPVGSTTYVYTLIMKGPGNITKTQSLTLNVQ